MTPLAAIPDGEAATPTLTPPPEYRVAELEAENQRLRTALVDAESDLDFVHRASRLLQLPIPGREPR